MRKIYLAALILLILPIVACGSSSDDPITVILDPPTGGIVRSGIASGPIDGFGSVIVNGNRYDTAQANFIVDDTTATQADLRVGQIVILKTQTDENGNLSADEVIFDDDVQGPITTIDQAMRTLTVLGQEILTDGTTSFDNDIQPNSLEGLMLGDVIEVSGLRNADGLLVASRIELKSDQDEYELHGFIRDLNINNLTFQINALIIDYSMAELEDFVNTELTDGDYVEVKGRLDEQTGIFLATKVEFEDEDERIGDEDDEANIEGIITEFTSSEAFVVAGINVITNADTEFENGTADQLALDVRVEVEGNYNAEGVIVADEVEFEDAGEIEIESSIEAIDVAMQMFTIFGNDLLVDTSTRFEDQSDVELDPLSLDDLSPGDFVDVRASMTADGLRAVIVNRTNMQDRSEIESEVESVGADSFVLLGVTVSTDVNTEYENANEEVISQTEFFSQLAVGIKVSAEGDKTSPNTLIASEVELED